MFVANCCKSPQIAKIATYAGFADPDFRSQHAPKKKIPNVRENIKARRKDLDKIIA